MRMPNQDWALELGPGEIRATAGPPESAHHGPVARASAGGGQDRHALLAVPLTEGEFDLLWASPEAAAREADRLAAEQDRLRPRPRDYSGAMRASLPLSDDGYDLLFGRAG